MLSKWLMYEQRPQGETGRGRCRQHWPPGCPCIEDPGSIIFLTQPSPRGGPIVIISTASPGWLWGEKGTQDILGDLLLGWAKATGCTPVPSGSPPLSWEQWATSAHHIPLGLSLGGRHLEPPRAEPLAMQPSRRGRGCDAGRGCRMPGSGGTPSRGLISSSCPGNGDRPGRSFLNLRPGPHAPHPALPWVGGGGVSCLCWKQGLCGDLEGRRKGVSWACEPSLPVYLPSPSGLPPAASTKPRPASISAFQGVYLGKFSP